MKNQRGVGGQVQRRSIGRRADGGDPVNRVLLTAAVILNEWRSMHPRRRPGRARPWLMPSWPSGLLLGRYRHRLASELVGDHILREHVRARLGISALSPEDVAILNAQALVVALQVGVASGNSSAESSGSDHVGPGGLGAMIASSLLDPADATAAIGARLLRLLPEVPDVEDAQPRQQHVVAAGLDPGAGTKRVNDLVKNQEDQPRLGQHPDVIELRRQLRVSAAELGHSRAELMKARTEADALQADVVRLTAERDVARAAVPSRRQRQRLENAEQLATDLRKARKQLSDLRREREAATRGHEKETRALQDALAGAQAERDKAAEARHRLEERLGDLPGRAHYLQNLLRRRIAGLEPDVTDLPRNQARSRIEREISQLRSLSEHIDEVLPADSRADPGAQTESETTSSVRRAARPVVEPFTKDHAADSNVAGYRPLAHASADRGLRVEVLGGGSEIGGSAVLVEAGGTRILVDAGVRPNADSPRAAAPPRIARALEGRVDAIVVTHGHNDHAGFVPKLLDDQRQAVTICTPATAALLPTMWNDARRVMARQADEMAAYGWLAPLYGEAEVEAAEKSLRPLTYGRARTVGELTIQFFDAGHILGAAGVVIRAGGQRVVITGDIFNLPQMSVGAAQLPPRLAREADLLVIESTYCHSRHPDRTSQVQDFVRAIGEVVGGGGRVLVPAFGLGRAQEVALMLREHLPDVPVLVDGLARPISDIYEREANLDIFGGKVQRVSDRKRLRLMRSFHSGVVVTTSGMLSGGFAVPWAQEILPDPHSALFVCGYQDEESAGRALQRLANRDDPTAPATLSLLTDAGPATVSVAARVETYSLSAHADRDGLSEIIGDLAPAQTMLVHGLGREQKAFRETLERARGHRTVRNDQPWSGPA